MSGGGYLEVEPGLYYLVETAPKGEAISEVLKHITEPPMVYFVNEAKGNNHSYFPFTLSFIDPETLFRFYNGEFLLIVIVDTSVMRNWLASRGMSVEILVDDRFAMEVVNQQPVGEEFHKILVSNHFWGRLPARASAYRSP